MRPGDRRDQQLGARGQPHRRDGLVVSRGPAYREERRRRDDRGCGEPNAAQRDQRRGHLRPVRFLTLVALVYFQFKVPETKGRSVQQIESELDASETADAA
jgi:hypothetical protein